MGEWWIFTIVFMTLTGWYIWRMGHYRRGPLAFLLLALHTNPLFAAIYMVLMKPSAQCPYCKEPIKKDARWCSYCHARWGSLRDP